MGKFSDSTTSSTGQTDKPDKEEKEYQHKSWSDYAEILAQWLVDLIAIPASFVAAILAQFLERNGSGRKILGFLGFTIGTLLSVDKHNLTPSTHRWGSFYRIKKMTIFRIKASQLGISFVF